MATSGMCCGRALFTVHSAGGSSSGVVELEVLDVPENRHTDFWTWRQRTWRGFDDGNESDILGLTWTQEKRRRCNDAEMKFVCGAENNSKKDDATARTDSVSTWVSARALTE